MENPDLLQALKGGRIVAKFRTTPSEQRDVILYSSQKLFGIGLASRKPRPWFLKFLVWVVVGFVLTVTINLRQTDLLSKLAPAALGLILAFVAMGLFAKYVTLRQRDTILKVLQKSNKFEDVVVACHDNGMSWITQANIFYIAFNHIESVSMFQDKIMLQYSVSMFCIPERGFPSEGDRASFIAELRAKVAHHRMVDFEAAQG